MSTVFSIDAKYAAVTWKFLPVHVMHTHTQTDTVLGKGMVLQLATGSGKLVAWGKLNGLIQE